MKNAISVFIKSFLSIKTVIDKKESIYYQSNIIIIKNKFWNENKTRQAVDSY